MEGQVGSRFTMYPCQCDFPLETEACQKGRFQISQKGRSQLQLLRHYTDSKQCRLLLVGPASGDEESLPMHLLLEELLQVSPSLQNKRVLVVAIHEKDESVQREQEEEVVLKHVREDVFKCYDGKPSASGLLLETKCVALGDGESVGKLDADLIWLLSET